MERKTNRSELSPPRSHPSTTPLDLNLPPRPAPVDPFPLALLGTRRSPLRFTRPPTRWRSSTAVTTREYSLLLRSLSRASSQGENPGQVCTSQQDPLVLHIQSVTCDYLSVSYSLLMPARVAPYRSLFFSSGKATHPSAVSVTSLLYFITPNLIFPPPLPADTQPSPPSGDYVPSAGVLSSYDHSPPRSQTQSSALSTHKVSRISLPSLYPAGVPSTDTFHPFSL